MKIKISDIIGATDHYEVMDILEAELRAVAYRVVRSGDQISVGRMKAASFGHINRTTSIVTAKASKHQVLLTWRLDYRPTLNFWCWLLLLVSTAFGWMIPILLYLYQMRMARFAMEQVFRTVTLECEFRVGERDSASCPRLKEIHLFP